MAAAPDFSSGPQREEILRVADRFLLAIGNHDEATMNDLLIEEGVAFFQRRDANGDGPVRPFTNATMLEPASDADPFIERYWSPTVLVRGGIAVVWAPYELRDDGERQHCGIDLLNMVYLDNAWRVATVFSTMEPSACDELVPETAVGMRPRDGWWETRNE